MRHLKCSYLDLMALPADYVDVVIKESKREAREARANKARTRH